MRIIVALVLLFQLCSVRAQFQSFSPEQMQKDLDYLNKYLRKWHPTYYQYYGKQDMNALYDRLKDSCSNTMNYNQFRTTLRRAINKVGCGHMGVLNPKDFDAKLKPKILPIDAWVVDSQLYVFNVRSQDSLPIGARIISINGVPGQQIYLQMLDIAVSDGYNNTFKDFSINRNFIVFYYFLYGQQMNFALELESLEGRKQTYTVAAIEKNDSMRLYKVPRPDSSNIVIQNPKIALHKLDFADNAVRLDINSFTGPKQKRTFKKVFKYIRKEKVEHLVIDLRDNGGGQFSNGSALLSYLTKAPIRGMRISRKPNLTAFNPRFKAGFFSKITPLMFMLNPFQFPTKAGWNHYFPFFRKGKNRFKGQVYVLTNGGTFSMSSYTSAHLKHKTNAILIGEETGGGEHGCRGMSGGMIQLPNTKLRVLLNVYHLHHNFKNEDQGRGVMPHYPTPYSLDDKLKRRDLEMAKVKELILGK